MYKTPKEFAIAMSNLLFEMRIESDTPYGDNDNPVPEAFAMSVIDNAACIFRIKKRIEKSILEHLEASPNDYTTRDNHHPTRMYYSYCTDVYDHAMAIDAYVDEAYQSTLKKTIYQCQHCMSDRVQVKAWVRPNEGNRYVDEVEGDPLGWCDDCEQNVVIETVEMSRSNEVIGFQVLDDSTNATDMHPHMEASFCVYSLDQARSMLDDDNLGDERGKWQLVTIWTDTVEEPTIMFEDGDPRDLKSSF